MNQLRVDNLKVNGFEFKGTVMHNGTECFVEGSFRPKVIGGRTRITELEYTIEGEKMTGLIDEGYLRADLMEFENDNWFADDKEWI